MSLFKMEKLRPLLQQNLFEIAPEHRLRLHGVLRECKIALDIVQDPCTGNATSKRENPSLGSSVTKTNSDRKSIQSCENC